MLNKKGFTLIELVMIIVILGILAAVAIPRYVDLSTDARTAAIKGGIGGLKSAIGIEVARQRGTFPTVTQLAAAIDGGTAAATYVTIADIFRADGTTLYQYRTFTDATCATATTAVGDTVLCVACEFAGCTPS